MNAPLTISYMAMQIDRESLDRRAAMAWTASSVARPGSKRLSLKTVTVALAVALAGATGTAALAHPVKQVNEIRPALVGESTCGEDAGDLASAGSISLSGQGTTSSTSIAPQKTDHDGNMIPMPQSGGRPW